MKFKKSPLTIQDKNQQDLDNTEDYPTLADLLREQNISRDFPNTVHRRRDLDSLG
jgi:hypothetical protein